MIAMIVFQSSILNGRVFYKNRLKTILYVTLCALIHGCSILHVIMHPPSQPALRDHRKMIARIHSVDHIINDFNIFYPPYTFS